jgi:hypothetical protein
MAERVWVVHLETLEMRLMHAVDAKEAVRLGDYATAPVGGYDPPTPTRSAPAQPRKEAA